MGYAYLIEGNIIFEGKRKMLVKRVCSRDTFRHRARLD